jgi:biotin carboxylase
MFTSADNGRGTYLLLLKADEFLRDRAIVAALRAWKGPVVGMSRLPALPPHRMFDHVLAGDPHQAASALEAVRTFEREHGMRPEAVVPITEMSLHPALEIAEAYGLPHLPRRSVEQARNKATMKEAFYRHGVSTARHEVFRNLEELRQSIQRLGLPVVVKPCEAAHSIGVRLVSTPEEIEPAFRYCSAGLEEVRDSWRIDNALFQVEQYIDAEREVSVEVFNQGDQRCVIAVTEKYLTPPPYFAEVGHMVPGAESNNEALKRLALDACAALELTHGVSHVEVRIDPKGGLFVVEVAARPGGDCIMDQVERAYGVNMYDLHVRSYMGQTQALPQGLRPRGTSAIAFLQPPEGTVTRVTPPRELPKEVMSLYILAREGDAVGGSLNYDRRAGAVECFWPGDGRFMGTRHLDMARQLSERIFTLKP